MIGDPTSVIKVYVQPGEGVKPRGPGRLLAATSRSDPAQMVGLMRAGVTLPPTVSAVGGWARGACFATKHTLSGRTLTR